MKNLAGNIEANETILEELYLANIPSFKCEQNNGEVPYSFIGKIGKWTLRRAWHYWIASVENDEDGLALKNALELHNKKHPIKNINLGSIIRCGGHAGCPSPDEYGAQPVYDENFNKQLLELGYKKEVFKPTGEEYISITVGEVSQLCNEGKLTVERYVKCYHIDEQIGLNEFADFVRGVLEIDFDNVSQNEEVVKLLRQREEIEGKIIEIDNMALIRYELEKLNLY